MRKGSFVCRECGYSSPGWLGRCPGCGQWNTISEEAVPARTGPRSAGRSAPGPAPALAPVCLTDVDLDAQSRIHSGLAEFDRVLGGGLVAGSVVLVGGEPGVGKSTLLLQSLLSMESRGVSTLLVSGEESAGQVKLRSVRLGGEGSRLRLLPETQTETVVAALEQLKPAVCVVDSVQTLWSAEVGSTPGSVAQIRDATAQLLRVAKDNSISLVLVGHVTKEGELAGPRVLEHMVDAVLSFEGERAQPFRILRAVKNRFGSTNEVGVFQMAEQGLVEVPDPASVFLEEGDLRSGSVVVPVLEGTRCLLAEVQALVAASNLAMPQRVARGVDRNRLAMIVAVLSRRARLPLFKCDIFVNVAGGLALEDPAADLAVALAIATAWRDGADGQGVAAFGEVSLTGKVRYALQGEKRIQELVRRGFPQILVPGRNVEEFSKAGGRISGLRLEAVSDVEQAVKQVTARSNGG
ncbi:MAG: DNA repair protein RadA [Thermoleophilia bacterium]|nr:DNA repair protein RadA [Thermoleophilia bacterium]